MPNTYIIRARRNDKAHTKDESPWYFAVASEGSTSPVYTTDKHEARQFNSLLSADSYAIALDMDSPEYQHAVDVL